MKLRVRWLVLTVLMCLPLAPLVQSQEAPAEKKPESAKRNLTVDDYFQIKRISGTKVSPEGNWVAYVVRTTILRDDRSESQIWMAPTAGGEPIPLTLKVFSSSSPQWSPDGKYLAFISSRPSDGRPSAAAGGTSAAGGAAEPRAQVWLLDRRGGEAQQLTETVQGVRGFEWSPAGDKLALTLQDPRPEDLPPAEGAAPRQRPSAPKPFVIDRLQFKRDNIGYLDRRRTHLYVFDLATKKLTQVTSGDYDDSDPAWSPDGRFLAFASNRTAEPDNNFNTDIWVVAADNPDKGQNLVRVTSNSGADRSPAWSPDGKWIVFTSQTDPNALDYATHHLAVAPATGGPATVLTQKLDRNVGRPELSADGKTIYFLLEDDGTRNLASIPAGGGEVTRIVGGQRNVTNYDVSKSGAFVLEISEPQMTDEIYVSDAGNLRRLTHTNDALFAQLRLGEVEYVRFKSKDGTEIAGYLTKPPGYSPELRYPTLLRIHGGPVSEFEASFNFEAQLFAANGYVVLNPNPRGSSGYGQKFSQAIFADWGNKDYEDVMAMVDYAIAKNIADAQKLGVGGWSYGGILTDHVLIRTDRFKAATSGASEFLYITNYGHDHYQRLWELELGLPWKNRVLWEKLSPFNQVEKIVTPTLILGGDRDWNVPVINSEQMYQSMKRLGRTVELVVYPNEFHGITRPTFIKDRFERYLTWYAKFVKGELPAKTAD